MSKHMSYQTVICKVNGITLLNLNNDKSVGNTQVLEIEDKKCDNNVVNQQLSEEEDNNKPDIDVEDNASDEDMSHTNDISAQNRDLDEEWEDMTTEEKQVFEMEKVENGIESVRQFVETTRRKGKVWHLCRWKSESDPCPYGSKWSGAMVNHIRSHLGIKPFRCNYCQKLFTIACNLKNHLRIHHGLKSKIVSNGGRRHRLNTGQSDSTEAPQETPTYSLGQSSKLRIFKPSFMNGKVAKGNDPYAPQIQRRYGPKRRLKKNQKYVDYEEDFDEYEDNEEMDEEEEESQVNEEEAEAENLRFYEQTAEEEEQSNFVIKRRYNKKLWFVCVWNPKQCKYRSHLMAEVLNHVKKHQNYNRQFSCNFSDCSSTFADRHQLMAHQQIHKRQKPFKCNFPNCFYSTINDRALKMHKIRHKRHLS